MLLGHGYDVNWVLNRHAPGLAGGACLGSRQLADTHHVHN
jgi:hypothetical protein